mmetsp:Transcript_18215/g.36678  ORF Transcript_18215/g.36678 Transcript_18215/m.36678 type:complete len:142 (+) Transcript_18215:2-427(+)
MGKMVLPGKKIVYRLFGENGKPLLDLMTLADEPAPQPEERILVRHPVTEQLRAYVKPTAVKPLLQLMFDGTQRSSGGSGVLPEAQISLNEARTLCIAELSSLRAEHTRSVDATPYKLSVSQKLYEFIHKLWMDEAPIADLK